MVHHPRVSPCKTTSAGRSFQIVTAETSQLRAMGDKADDILASFGLSDED